MTSLHIYVKGQLNIRFQSRKRKFKAKNKRNNKLSDLYRFVIFGWCWCMRPIFVLYDTVNRAFLYIHNLKGMEN